MPSFDIVSQINLQEIDNAVNSVLRELSNRYDFKGSKFTITFTAKDKEILINAEDEYKLEQINESLRAFVTKRGLDFRVLDCQKVENASGNARRQLIKLKNGIEQEVAKKIVKFIKESKIKVQASIRGEEVRVDGKKRDELQQIIQLVKQEDFETPLQFINFRD